MTHKEIRIEGVLILGILINRLRSDCIESATCIWINLIKESTRKLFTWDSTKELDENKRHNKLTNQPSSPTWEVEMNFFGKTSQVSVKYKVIVELLSSLSSSTKLSFEFCWVLPSYVEFFQVLLFHKPSYCQVLHWVLLSFWVISKFVLYFVELPSWLSIFGLSICFRVQFVWF
jgi:hypothetical protein